jgi:integrase/recombinase XerD
VLKRLASFLDQDSLLGAELSDLRSFIDRGEFSTEYQAAETTHLIGFYRWAHIEGHRDSDPTIRLERPSRKKGRPRPMPDEHVARALGATGPERTWFHLGAFAGLRASETAALRGEDYGRGTIEVRDGKGGKRRVVPVPGILAVELAHLPRMGVWFPHGWDASRPIAGGQLSRWANLWLHENEIPETFHQLRHWYATQLRREGVPLEVIRDLLGHASVATTEIYTKVDDDEGALAVAKLRSPRAA